MRKLEKWNVDDTDWMGLSGFCLVTMYCVTALHCVPTGSVGTQCKARCAANHDQRLAYTERSASCTAFPSSNLGTQLTKLQLRETGSWSFLY